MGKGDKKTKRGKITMGTYGVRRPKSKNKKDSVVAATKEEAKPASKKKSEKED